MSRHLPRVESPCPIARRVVVIRSGPREDRLDEHARHGLIWVAVASDGFAPSGIGLDERRSPRQVASLARWVHTKRGRPQVAG